MAPALFATTHRDSFNTLDMAAAEPMGNHDNYYARAGVSLFSPPAIMELDQC